MLKLNASFSKKVPAELDYSSQSYHASVEIELPDGLTQQQLQERIHQTFSLVRDSVESEIGGTTQPQIPFTAQQPQPVTGNGNGHHGNGNGHANGHNGNGKSDPASAKQVKYLVDLAAQKGADLSAMLRRYHANSVNELTREACSKLIDEISKR